MQSKLEMAGCLRCCCVNLMEQNHGENHGENMAAKQKHAEGGWALELLWA